MKHIKNTALLALVMMCFTSPSHSASFEPLGPDRSLGDVYADLMTADELNQYIDSQGKSDAHVHVNLSTGEMYRAEHFPNSPYEISDIIDTSALDVFRSNRYYTAYLLVIKGDSTKYSYAYLFQPYPLVDIGPAVIRVFNINGHLNDGTIKHTGRPINIATNKATAQVPEPSTLLAMGLVGILLGFTKIVRKFNLK